MLANIASTSHTVIPRITHNGMKNYKEKKKYNLAPLLVNVFKKWICMYIKKTQNNTQKSMNVISN